MHFMHWTSRRVWRRSEKMKASKNRCICWHSKLAFGVKKIAYLMKLTDSIHFRSIFVFFSFASLVNIVKMHLIRKFMAFSWIFHVYWDWNNTNSMHPFLHLPSLCTTLVSVSTCWSRQWEKSKIWWWWKSKGSILKLILSWNVHFLFVFRSILLSKRWKVPNLTWLGFNRNSIRSIFTQKCIFLISSVLQRCNTHICNLSVIERI